MLLKTLYSCVVWPPVIGPVVVAWARSMPEPMHPDITDQLRHQSDVSDRWRRRFEAFGIVAPLRRLDEPYDPQRVVRLTHPASSLGTGNLPLACVGALICGLGVFLAAYTVALAKGLPYAGPIRDTAVSATPPVAAWVAAGTYALSGVLAIVGGAHIALGRVRGPGLAVVAPISLVLSAIVSRIVFGDQMPTSLAADLVVAGVLGILCAGAYAFRAAPAGA